VDFFAVAGGREDWRLLKEDGEMVDWLLIDEKAEEDRPGGKNTEFKLFVESLGSWNAGDVGVLLGRGLPGAGLRGGRLWLNRRPPSILVLEIYVVGEVSICE